MIITETNDGANAHRTHFLIKKKKRAIKNYALAIYLIILIVVIGSLHLTVNDGLVCPLVTYVLVSSFVVFVCATNCRCCSAKRIYHKPLPKFISLPNHLYVSSTNQYSNIYQYRSTASRM